MYFNISISTRLKFPSLFDQFADFYTKIGVAACVSLL